MDILESLTEAKNLLHSAKIVADTYEADPDNYSALREALDELVSEFKRVEEV